MIASSYKSLSKLKGEAQKAFNSYIRKRDEKQPCIYCGKPMNRFDKLNPIEAAHFHPVSTSEALRFNEDNCFGAHKFCNQVNDRELITANVTKRIGPGHVIALQEHSHSLAKFTRSEIEEIITKYK